MTDGIRCGEAHRSRAKILDRAARLATVLNTRGVGPDSNVALMARNAIEVVETHLAARLLDANVVPINCHGTSDDAGYILRDASPVILLGDADLLATTDSSIAKLAFGETLDALLAQVEPETFTPQGLGASLVYTSGTSGVPKGVKRLPANPEQAAHRREVLRLVYDGHAENRALVTGPLYHLFSLATAMTNFTAGASLTIMPRFDAEEMLRLVERDAITHANVVPTMLVRLLRLPDAVQSRYDVSSLRHITQSGAPCAAEIKRAAIRLFGPLIHETYGSTETGVITQIRADEWLKRPGTVGRPVSTGEVRILGEDGQELPPGEIGDVYLRMHGTPDFTYLGDPEKRAAMERDGLITVGDMGWLDVEGFLYICDRRGDMAISGGINIYPAEIEAALLSHAAVADAAAFGLPDPEYGEVLHAHVALVKDAQCCEAELLAHLDGRLAKTKWPRRIVIDPDLPRTESGKVLKHVLRDRARKGITQ